MCERVRVLEHLPQGYLVRGVCVWGGVCEGVNVRV